MMQMTMLRERRVLDLIIVIFVSTERIGDRFEKKKEWINDLIKLKTPQK